MNQAGVDSWENGGLFLPWLLNKTTMQRSAKCDTRREQSGFVQ